MVFGGMPERSNLEPVPSKSVDHKNHNQLEHTFRTLSRTQFLMSSAHVKRHGTSTQ